jgi:hypothetical protein
MAYARSQEPGAGSVLRPLVAAIHEISQIPALRKP